MKPRVLGVVIALSCSVANFASVAKEPVPGPSAVPLVPAADADTPCDRQAQPASCLLRMELPNGTGSLAYYVSQLPSAAPESALLVMHGYPRDAAHSLNAGLAAARGAGVLAKMLVVAPLIQVGATDAARCSTPKEAPAQTGDARWTCGGWLSGEMSSGAKPISSFAAMDALVAELHRQWPSLRVITLAGFSAGAQFMQHYAAFAASSPEGVSLRFVVADPGTWMYFDPVRPVAQLGDKPVPDVSACGAAESYPAACSLTMQTPSVTECPRYDTWKYGVARMPTNLGRDAAEARERYRHAAITYVVGALDSGPGRGTFDKVLDHSCSAELQGPFRLQRAQGYLAYERDTLRPAVPRTLIVVRGCAHDVGCVLPSAAVRDTLFAAFKVHPR